MKSWNELNKFQKVFLAICIISMAMFVPEIMYLVDLGGIELMFAFIAASIKPISLWVSLRFKALKDAISLVFIAFQNSASARPNVFITQAAFCVLALFITHSWVFAFSFFAPSMLLNGVLI